jgi:Cu/Zn superoxide dismutase
MWAGAFLFSLVCLYQMAVAQANMNHGVYTATIEPIASATTSRNSGVIGSVVVFDAGDGVTVGYGGFVEGLQANLEATTCAATNGCGVHIHSGTSCFNSTTQGGHYFESPVTDDPWMEERYSSDETGFALFSSVAVIGTSNLEGRAFVVHAEDGSRVGCGLLTELKDDTRILQANTVGLASSTVESESKAVIFPGTDRICVGGNVDALQPDILSFQAGGLDCNATNGCGVHIHRYDYFPSSVCTIRILYGRQQAADAVGSCFSNRSPRLLSSGTDCTDSTTQGGHFYNADVVDVDPWLLVGYERTNANGEAFYLQCLVTGEANNEGHALIVHSEDGSRLSCGILQFETTTTEAIANGMDGSVLSRLVGIGLLFEFIIVLATHW